MLASSSNVNTQIVPAIVVPDYGEVKKKTQNHSGSIPNMENTLERSTMYRYKTKMDKRS